MSQSQSHGTENSAAAPLDPSDPAPGAEPAPGQDWPSAVPDAAADPDFGVDGADRAAAGFAHQPPQPNPGTLLAELALTRALGRPGRRVLHAGRNQLVLVRVPNADWLGPVETAIHRDARNASVFKIRSDKPRERESLVEEVGRSLTQGRLVAVISTNAQPVPASLVAAADRSISLALPDVALVTRAVRRFTGSRVRSRLDPQDLAGLGLPDLVAAMRPCSGPGPILARLRRAGERRAGANGLPDVPALEDLGGYGEARSWALGLVADVERFRAGALAGDALECAIFGGPPGTGKTTLAQAVARSARLPLVVTSVAEWLNGSSYLDNVLKQQNAFFDELLARAPCIGFLDEIDALPSRDRMSDRNADYWTTILTNQFLQMDRIRKAGRGVILLAATNHIDRLDPALRRPGRFDRTFTIAPPDEAALAAILRTHLGADLAGADLVGLARLGLGATGAEAVGWIRAARARARREGRDLTVSDLAETVRPRDSRPVAFQRAVALHEAGHAIVATRLGIPVLHVSIEPRGAAAGWTQIRSVDAVPTRARIEAQVTEILGGRAADILLGTGPHAGASADLRLATARLAALRTSHGLGRTLLALDEAEASALLARDPHLARSVERHLQSLMRESLRLVAANRDAVAALAEMLLLRRVVTGREVEAIAAAHPGTASAGSRRAPSPDAPRAARSG
ncbi:AAA family ATPase [Methylobacterium planeticum]|uniref:AAA family ATPase n=1 Tax=Methylobacterium planeticum TaxID=2615211 RepID=A0A6N6MK82_9HYPH|nr:AAA family ATPase [Methylobacterium planeticum]KAB1070032.1 AAA family ATPase [Methylobacterium planeticum]